MKNFKQIDNVVYLHEEQKYNFPVEACWVFTGILWIGIFKMLWGWT